MSESAKQPSDPGEDKKEMEAKPEMNPATDNPKSVDPDFKTKDDIHVGTAADKPGASETKYDQSTVQERKESVPDTSLDATAATGSATERTLTAGPVIKVEPGVVNEQKDSQEGQIGGASIKTEKEMAPGSTFRENASPLLTKTCTVENKDGGKENTLVSESVENTVRTATGDTMVSSKEQEDVKSNANSTPVQLSGSSTETIDTPSIDMSSSSAASTPSIVNTINETKTNVVPTSEKREEKVSTGGMIDVKDIKKEPVTDTEMDSLAGAHAISESEKMDIDTEVKSTTSISQNSIQSETQLKDVAHENASSNNDVQSKVTGDVQKQETATMPNFNVQPKESVTVDIVPKKETLPQMVVEQSKAVHEIIAEQSSRLDRDRLPTPVPLDRKSLSVSPVGESLVSVSVPSSIPAPVPGLVSVPSSVPAPVPGLASVPSSVPTPTPGLASIPPSVPTPIPVLASGPSLVPTPVPGLTTVPTSIPTAVPTPVPLPSVSSSNGIKLPMTVPPEGDSLGPAPVIQEKSEPVSRPDSQGPAIPDSKAPVEEPSDDWDIPASDEDGDDVDSQTGDGVEKKKRKVIRRGYWEPPIDIIVDLYQKIDRDGILELNWKCPGRRPPSEEGDKEEEKEKLEDVQDEEAMEIPEEEDPTEFDFDMDIDLDASAQKMTPRRNIGQGQAQGSGKKRVARMDKVLNDIFRHRKIGSNITDSQKMNADEKDADQAMDTSISPILAPRPTDKFHIRNDLN